MGTSEGRPAGSTVASIRVVTAFYAKMLRSPRLQGYFAGVSMDRLVSKQSALIDAILAAGPTYSATEMRRLHLHLKIDDGDYDEMLRLLAETLVEHGAAPEKAAAIELVFASYRDAIVTERDEWNLRKMT